MFAGIIPFAIAGGVLLSKTGRYKPLHVIGWVPIIAAYGIFSTLKNGSSMAAWVCSQLLCALGCGLLAGILLPAIQAPLDEGLVATTTGVWSFARNFGALWGVTIPGAIFNNQCRQNAGSIVTDPELLQSLTGGRAYEYATRAFLDSLAPASREQAVRVFQDVSRLRKSEHSRYLTDES